MQNIVVENAKVMSKGQITLPKEIRNKLGVSTGDRVTLIYDGEQVIMMNAAVYAMKMLQRDMSDVSYKTDLDSDEKIIAMVAEERKDLEIK